MNWFYRYNLVFCPLQVLLAVKLAEKVSGDVVLGGADRMYWFYRYNLVFCPPLLGKSSYIENVYSMSEVLEGVIPCV